MRNISGFTVSRQFLILNEPSTLVSIMRQLPLNGSKK